MLIERYRLNKDTVTTIGEFSILWCQFEQVFFNSDAKQGKIIAWADSYHIDDELRSCCKDVRIASSAYLQDTEMTTINTRVYSENNQGNTQTNKYIYDFLNEIDPGTILKGCILYIQRIRNNLFHGLKGIHTLNDQKKMFDTINGVLNYVLKKDGM